MPTQSIDLSGISAVNFNGSAVEQINLNGAGIWTKPVDGVVYALEGVTGEQDHYYLKNNNGQTIIFEYSTGFIYSTGGSLTVASNIWCCNYGCKWGSYVTSIEPSSPIPADSPLATATLVSTCIFDTVSEGYLKATRSS